VWRIGRQGADGGESAVWWLAAAVAYVTLAVATFGCTHFALAAPNGLRVSFWDSKDNAIKLDEGTYDPETKTLRLAGLGVTNNASGPINAYMAGLDVLSQRLIDLAVRLEALKATMTEPVAPASSPPCD
jgi:hypothetical protein